MNKHYGSDFDDFLRQEGILEACGATARERVERSILEMLALGPEQVEIRLNPDQDTYTFSVKKSN